MPGYRNGVWRPGYAMPIQTYRELAEKCYMGRLEYGWRRPDLKTTQQIFNSLGLAGEFWHLG
jgi:hypothetical protein